MGSLLWERRGGTFLTASPEIYDLCRLVQVGGEGKKGESDRLAYEYIAKHLTKYSVEVKLGCEVQLFKDQLSPLLTSTVIKPDVAIYCDNFPLMFFEVHSSPYECTLIKCIVTVTEQIRLHHLYDNTSQNITYTGFTFPKIGSKRCVAKVAVMWQEFKFKYTVEFLENPDNVASLVEKAVQKAIENTSNTKCKQLQPSMGIINLSPAELTGDCGRFAQLASQESILLLSSSHVYKNPVTAHGAKNLLLIAAGLTKFDHVISLSHLWLQETLFFKYETVPFDPLEVSEASSCLLSFVYKRSGHCH